MKKAVISLTKNAVETRPFFTPIDLLPFYETDLECKSAKDIYRRGLLLPSFPSLKQKELKRHLKKTQMTQFYQKDLSKLKLMQI